MESWIDVTIKNQIEDCLKIDLLPDLTALLMIDVIVQTTTYLFSHTPDLILKPGSLFNITPALCNMPALCPFLIVTED